MYNQFLKIYFHPSKIIKSTFPSILHHNQYNFITVEDDNLNEDFFARPLFTDLKVTLQEANVKNARILCHTACQNKRVRFRFKKCWKIRAELRKILFCNVSLQRSRLHPQTQTSYIIRISGENMASLIVLSAVVTYAKFLAVARIDFEEKTYKLPLLRQQHPASQ